MPPELTILLPVRDAAAYLPAALDSLSAQTWRNWVCLAQDDGSSDDSQLLLRQHARRDARFHVGIRSQPLGVAATLQELLEWARTPWVARMDADDVSPPNRLQLQLQAAAQEPEVELWAGQVTPLGETGEGWCHYLEWLNGIGSEEEIVRQAFTECPLPHATWLARRATLTAAGGYRSGRFPEDYDLFLRLLRRGTRFGKVSRVLLHLRDHPQRETHTSPRTHRDALLRLKATHFAHGTLRGELPHLPQRPVAIWGAGKTGRILARTLEEAGLEVAAMVDPTKPGKCVAGRQVLAPEASPPGRHLLLVAVGPRHLRQHLRQRFSREGRRFGTDYIWMH